MPGSGQFSCLRWRKEGQLLPCEGGTRSEKTCCPSTGSGEFSLDCCRSARDTVIPPGWRTVTVRSSALRASLRSRNQADSLLNGNRVRSVSQEVDRRANGHLCGFDTGGRDGALICGKAPSQQHYVAQYTSSGDMILLRGSEMKASRVLRFGPPNMIIDDDLPRPEPAPGQLLVRVKAAGVGHWDALVREGKLHQPLPLILGSELSGIVEAIGADVSGFKTGDEVYGATNEQFTGAYAEYALPSARRMAQKPKTLNFIEAASAPIVSVTAWQMLFEYAHVTAGQTVLIHGAAGNVGAYAVQLASQAGLHVVATAASADLDYVRGRGAGRVVDHQTERFEESLSGVDVVLDTVGGDTQQRSLGVLKPGGILVSAVSPVPETAQKRYGVRAAYFYVDVTTARLNKITELFNSRKLATDVGTVLPLEGARIAHEMLEGAPHKRGKIVLSIAA